MMCVTWTVLSDIFMIHGNSVQFPLFDVPAHKGYNVFKKCFVQYLQAYAAGRLGDVTGGRKSMQQRKIWFLAVMILLAGMIKCPVRAANSNSQIETVINYYMTGARKTDGRTMGSCFRDPTGYDLTIKQTKKKLPCLNIVCQKNKEISYKVKSIKITGNTSIVEVRVISPDIKNATDQAIKAFVDYTINHRRIPQRELDALFDRYMKDALKEKGIQMYSHTIIFNMEKTSAGWKIQNRSDDDYTDYNLVLGRFLESLEEYGNNSR